MFSKSAYLCYDWFLEAVLETRLAIADGQIVEVRKSYYGLEEVKQHFDRAVYDWKSLHDWRNGREEVVEEGWELSRLNAVVQKEMVQVQESFRLFLKANQDEAFPVTITRRVLSPYEQMLFRYQSLGIEPTKKYFVAGAD